MKGFKHYILKLCRRESIDLHCWKALSNIRWCSLRCWWGPELKAVVTVRPKIKTVKVVVITVNVIFLNCGKSFFIWTEHLHFQYSVMGRGGVYFGIFPTVVLLSAEPSTFKTFWNIILNKIVLICESFWLFFFKYFICIFKLRMMNPNQSDEACCDYSLSFSDESDQQLRLARQIQTTDGIFFIHL